MEMLFMGGGKPLPPKYAWEKVPDWYAGYGSGLGRTGKYLAALTLSGYQNYATFLDLDTTKVIGSGGYTNNLLHYAEKHAVSTMGATQLNAVSFTAGGYTSGNPTRNCYRMNLSGTPPSSVQTISITPNTFTARTNVGLCGTHGESNYAGYIYGGANSTGEANPLSTMYRVDLTGSAGIVAMTYTGTPGVLMNPAMCHHHDIGLWMHGGNTGSAVTNKLWRMDLTTNTWTEVIPTGMTMPALKMHSMYYYGGYIYIFGGSDGSNNNLFTYRYEVATNTLTMLDGTLPIAAHLTGNVLYYDGYLYGYSGPGVGNLIRMRI